MNSPKIYLTLFLVSIVALFSLITLSPHSSNETITAKVISQTLTQSLDGHRRFVNIETEHGESDLISIPPQIDCPQGSTILLAQTKLALSPKLKYQFLDCYKSENHRSN